jgi:hypothetical protein
MESSSWIILIAYGVIGITTTIIMNSWWTRYYWANTFAAGLSAIIFATVIYFLDGTNREEGEGIMIALFAYFFFIPLTFMTGAIFKLVRRMASS